MRFLFYDRVLEVDKSKSIVGVKTFALSEEFHRRHLAKVALVPGVILIEAMAQLLGWLISYSHDFNVFAIMSLIDRVEVAANLKPGVESRIYGKIVSSNRKDTLGKAWMEVNGEAIGSIERIIYTHFDETDPADLAARFRYYSGRTDL